MAKLAEHARAISATKSLSPATQLAKSAMSDASGTPRHVRTGGTLSSLKSFVGVNLIRGESDDVFDEDTRQSKIQLKNNIDAIERLTAQISVVEKTSQAYFSALKQANALVYEMAKNNGVNELVGNEQTESIFLAHTHILETTACLTEQYTQSLSQLDECKRRLKEGEKYLRELRTKKCKLGEHHAQVKNLALQKCRERTTKKLGDKQMS